MSGVLAGPQHCADFPAFEAAIVRVIPFQPGVSFVVSQYLPAGEQQPLPFDRLSAVGTQVLAHFAARFLSRRGPSVQYGDSSPLWTVTPQSKKMYQQS